MVVMHQAIVVLAWCWHSFSAVFRRRALRKALKQLIVAMLDLAMSELASGTEPIKFLRLCE